MLKAAKQKLQPLLLSMCTINITENQLKNNHSVTITIKFQPLRNRREPPKEQRHPMNVNQQILHNEPANQHNHPLNRSQHIVNNNSSKPPNYPANANHHNVRKEYFKPQRYPINSYPQNMHNEEGNI